MFFPDPDPEVVGEDGICPAQFHPAQRIRHAADQHRGMDVAQGGPDAELRLVVANSPRQLEVKSARTFNRGGASRTISSLGGDNAGPAQPGDTAGVAVREAYVYFEIIYRTE